MKDDGGRALSAHGDLMLPQEAQEPILSDGVRGALMDWLSEIWARDALAAAGVAPRCKALFHGPPGVGKTTLAHHLAARLGLPLLAVRSDRIVSKYMGETARHIGRIFDSAQEHGPVVLFFDEFEGLGFRRGDEDKAAALDNRQASGVLLTRLEQHRGMVIAATNLPRLLDPAIWRRFELQIGLDLPGPGERRLILSRYLAPWGLPRPALVALGDACEGASPALLRQLCEGIKRHLVVGPLAGWPMGREAVLGRVLASVALQPEAGVPRLWSLGLADRAVAALPWPLPLAADVAAMGDVPQADSGPAGRVVALRGAGGGQ